MSAKTIFFLALFAACGGAPPAPAESSDESRAPTVRVGALTVHCALEGAALTYERASELASLPEGCGTYAGDEPARSPLVVQLLQIPIGDAGSEAELAADPDGALRWAMAGPMSGAEHVGEDTVEIDRIPTDLYHLRGEVPGMEGPRDVLVGRQIRNEYYLVMIASVEVDDDARGAQAMEILRSVHVE